MQESRYFLVLSLKAYQSGPCSMAGPKLLSRINQKVAPVFQNCTSSSQPTACQAPSLTPTMGRPISPNHSEPPWMRSASMRWANCPAWPWGAGIQSSSSRADIRDQRGGVPGSEPGKRSSVAVSGGLSAKTARISPPFPCFPANVSQNAPEVTDGSLTATDDLFGGFDDRNMR
jgi:hypothetical protein